MVTKNRFPWGGFLICLPIAVFFAGIYGKIIALCLVIILNILRWIGVFFPAQWGHNLQRVYLKPFYSSWSDFFYFLMFGTEVLFLAVVLGVMIFFILKLKRSRKPKKQTRSVYVKIKIISAQSLYRYSSVIAWSIVGLFLIYKALSIYDYLDKNIPKDEVGNVYALMKNSSFLTPSYVRQEESSFLNSAKVHYEKGMAFFNQEKWADALKELQLAVKFFDSDFSVWSRIGYSALQVPEKTKEALEAYNMATKIKPTDEGSWNNKGVALERLGKLQEALASFKKALEIDPKDQTAQSNRTNVVKKLEEMGLFHFDLTPEELGALDSLLARE